MNSQNVSVDVQKFIEACSEEMKHLGEGSTRADLLRVFEPGGGLSTWSSETFWYKKFRHIQVEVEFTSDKEHDDVRVLDDLDDMIVSLTAPHFVESVVAD